MKRWLWQTDDGTWKPIIVCPYCSTVWFHWSTKCPHCRKCVHLPKEDYLENMGEEDS